MINTLTDCVPWQAVCETHCVYSPIHAVKAQNKTYVSRVDQNSVFLKLFIIPKFIFKHFD